MEFCGLMFKFVKKKKINDMSFYLKKLEGKKEINPKPTKENKKR